MQLKKGMCTQVGKSNAQIQVESQSLHNRTVRSNLEFQWITNLSGINTSMLQKKRQRENGKHRGEVTLLLFFTETRSL